MVTSELPVSAPIGMASGSMTMSAAAMPYSSVATRDDLRRQVEALVGLHRDLVVVVGQRDDRGVVLLDQWQDRGHPVVLGGDGVDQRPALVGREPGLERLDDRGVDADRQVGERLDQPDRLGQQLGSSVSGTPMLTSSTSAPPSTWALTSRSIAERSPARSCSWKIRRPVGLIRSPMMQKRRPWPITTSLVALRRTRLLGLATGRSCADRRAALVEQVLGPLHAWPRRRRRSRRRRPRRRTPG